MYKKPEKYSEVINIRGVDIYIPEYGFGLDADNDSIIVPVEIIKRSNNPLEQYWERQLLPDEYEQWLEDERSIKEHDKTYFNYELEKLRIREWHRRIYGVWIWIKGKPHYIPGSYYFFLNYWILDGGFPTFRKSDYKKALFWKWIEYNPYAYGLLEVTKRRGGKSVFAACMVTEYATRTLKAICNMQSKSRDDAKKLFDFHIVTPFQSLWAEFIPLYDTNKGTKPETKLSFYAASARGKNASVVDEQLKSEISFEDSKPYALDGQKLARVILDERGKVDFDLIDAHLIIRKCLLDWRMNIVGKMIVTTTVEEIGIQSKFFELWQQSDPSKIIGNSTKSGLFSFFIPADEAGDCDIYGDPYIEKNREVIMQNRANLEGNSRGLIAEMRKDPLSEREAFMVLNSQCHFDIMMLNEFYDTASSMQDSVLEYGNFIWQDGKPFTKAIWEKCNKENARWIKPKGFKLPEDETIEWRGGLAIPKKYIQFISGCDPFQNDIVEGSEGSKGSSGVLNRFEDGLNSSIYNRMFVCKYHARPLTASLFHMDMALQCFAFGCRLLPEAKMDGGLRKFFIDNGLEALLIRLNDKQNYGIDPNQDNKVLLVNSWEAYLYKEGKEGKLIYPTVINQLGKFNINETQLHDEVMGLGWTLVADYFFGYNPTKKEKTLSITDFFPKKRIA